MRFTVRRLMLVVAAWALDLRLCRQLLSSLSRSMSEGAEFGLTGIVYVPFREHLGGELLARHDFLCMVYAPLNWLDQRIFGAPPPMNCFLRLSG